MRCLLGVKLRAFLATLTEERLLVEQSIIFVRVLLRLILGLLDRSVNQCLVPRTDRHGGARFLIKQLIVRITGLVAVEVRLLDD